MPGTKKRNRVRKLHDHVSRRFRERLGVQLTRELERELVRQIQANRMEFVERHSNRTTLWRTVLEGQKVILCYDKRRGVLVTAWLDRNGVPQSQGA
jgi:hypothetical protein